MDNVLMIAKIILLVKRIRNIFFPNVKIKSVISNEVDTHKKRIVIFSHYDKDGKIDEYVLNYLKQLYRFADIVFVTTSERIRSTEFEKLSFCKKIIVTENRGYDFGAWKTGMDVIDLYRSSYEALILCNDSVYGPLYDLANVFEQASKNGSDIFSITDSYEISYHLQSYFVIYQKKVWEHPYFKAFWSRYYFYERKYKLIMNSEIGYMSTLLSCGFSASSFCPVEKKHTINPMQIEWKRLILEDKCPFIKRELLIKNTLNVDISDWEMVIKETDYPFSLISNHSKRFENA